MSAIWWMNSVPLKKFNSSLPKAKLLSARFPARMVPPVCASVSGAAANEYASNSSMQAPVAAVLEITHKSNGGKMNRGGDFARVFAGNMLKARDAAQKDDIAR